ncbi:MAG: hypothetical protein A3B04_01585 [Candidatus Portnoybacteria bacterium RIFCSPLOWO2_02_FULL_39_11]|uniref:Uncharacterized protein n=1 Tax=Candidatus Portnoybacteria bacterium RIFCSPLOWO2_02_FULL_39_11 TaxID=1802001 RepID=A0A1G2FQW2_9BACT|nr:MAG: hypothetical protein A3B04_01585 [Candidatus Portnoybacteria bacterium RIFCSPLOWO2_02_FULL_39_11]
MRGRDANLKKFLTKRGQMSELIAICIMIIIAIPLFKIAWPIVKYLDGEMFNNREREINQKNERGEP